MAPVEHACTIRSHQYLSGSSIAKGEAAPLAQGGDTIQTAGDEYKYTHESKLKYVIGIGAEESSKEGKGNECSEFSVVVSVEN